MKKYLEEIITRVEYQYETEEEREQHKEQMLNDGWEHVDDFETSNLEMSDHDYDNILWKPSSLFLKSQTIEFP